MQGRQGNTPGDSGGSARGSGTGKSDSGISAVENDFLGGDEGRSKEKAHAHLALHGVRPNDGEIVVGTD
jgi:hypothetical protein